MTVSDSIGVEASPKRGKRAKAALDIEAQVAVLHQMTVAELRCRYAAVMGEPSRSRHKLHRIRKIAWRIQALAEGDLTERARRRAKELADDSLCQRDPVPIPGRLRATMRPSLQAVPHRFPASHETGGT